MTFVKLFSILPAGAPPAGPALPLVQGWLLPVLIPIGALVAAIYYVNRRPLRRQENARFLLDLIESWPTPRTPRPAYDFICWPLIWRKATP
jgi:hypothetical protein